MNAVDDVYCTTEDFSNLFDEKLRYYEENCSFNDEEKEREFLLEFFNDLLFSFKKIVLNDLLYAFIDSIYYSQYKESLNGDSTINYLI